MKKTAILLLIFMLPIISLNAQNEEGQIKKIRDLFTTVNSNLNTYKMVEKDINDESTEGGLMKAYYDKDQLILLHCEFYGETGNTKEDYYYYNSKLFFVFSVITHYSAPIYSEEDITETKEENRYYFADDKMIRYIDKDKTKINKESESYKKIGNNIFNESKRLMTVFNNN